MAAYHGPRRTKNPPPLSRVELHVHLDGSIRYSTAWELCKTKGLTLPGDGSLAALKSAVKKTEQANLTVFLSGFGHVMPAFVNDLSAIERMAVEFCEDAAKNGLLYVEARYSPHLLLSAHHETEDSPSVDQVVEAVLSGIDRGQRQFGVTVRCLLCCIRGMDDLSQDILRLAVKYRDRGVVGIDIAGDEEGLDVDEEHMFNDKVRHVFDEARKHGIRRTVHAGEVGPAKCVEQALDVLHANRIGHGYRVLEDQALYDRCLKERVHFETCPTSSILTGAQPLSTFYHAVVKFAEDEANFSINSDDPMITGRWVGQEYEVVRSWGLNEAHIVRANVNALKSAFLPEDEKKGLLRRLYQAYHMDVDP